MVGALMLVVVERVPILKRARTCENSIPSHLKAKQVKYVAYVAHLPNFTFIGRIEASGRLPRCRVVHKVVRFETRETKRQQLTHFMRRKMGWKCGAEKSTKSPKSLLFDVEMNQIDKSQRTNARELRTMETTHTQEKKWG